MADVLDDWVTAEEARARDAYVMAFCAVCSAVATKVMVPTELAGIYEVPGFPICDACAKDIDGITNPTDMQHLIVALAAICALREQEYWDMQKGGDYEH